MIKTFEYVYEYCLLAVIVVILLFRMELCRHLETMEKVLARAYVFILCFGREEEYHLLFLRRKGQLYVPNDK